MKNFKNVSLAKAFALTGVILLTSACNNNEEYFQKVSLQAPVEVEKGDDGRSSASNPIELPDEEPAIRIPVDEPVSEPEIVVVAPPMPTPAPDPVMEPPRAPDAPDAPVLVMEPPKLPVEEPIFNLPIEMPVKEPEIIVDAPIKLPVDEPVKEPEIVVEAPVEEPTKEPVREPDVVADVEEPTKEPVKEPIKEPVKEPEVVAEVPAEEPVREPAKDPSIDPPKLPVEEPVVIAPPKLPVEEPTVVVDPPRIKDEICNKEAEACDLTPQVTKAGVVTMLLAFGDLLNEKVVISEGSARLLAQNSVKFASPVAQPRILVVKDGNHNGESIYDTEYIAKVLLANYNKVDMINEPGRGLSASDLEGYDLIWFNNPGHQMGQQRTMKALMAFKGGVILSGDDLTQGRNFSLEPLTGLRFEDNGTSMSCGDKHFRFDNNDSSNRYQITISEDFLPGIPKELQSFEYGNDIDKSYIAVPSAKYEVLATAKGAPGTCEGTRPVIVRYAK